MHQETMRLTKECLHPNPMDHTRNLRLDHLSIRPSLLVPENSQYSRSLHCLQRGIKKTNHHLLSSELDHKGTVCWINQRSCPLCTVKTRKRTARHQRGLRLGESSRLAATTHLIDQLRRPRRCRFLTLQQAQEEQQRHRSLGRSEAKSPSTTSHSHDSIASVAVEARGSIA